MIKYAADLSILDYATEIGKQIIITGKNILDEICSIWNSNKQYFFKVLDWYESKKIYPTLVYTSMVYFTTSIDADLIRYLIDQRGYKICSENAYYNMSITRRKQIAKIYTDQDVEYFNCVGLTNIPL